MINDIESTMYATLIAALIFLLISGIVLFVQEGVWLNVLGILDILAIIVLPILYFFARKKIVPK